MDAGLKYQKHNDQWKNLRSSHIDKKGSNREDDYPFADCRCSLQIQLHPLLLW